jgi:Zn-dependent alcohol dehydrogenases
MKAAVVKGNSKVEIENFDISDIGSNDLLIKMQSCGICGSDVEKVFGKYGQPSMRLGHEPAGEVIKTGDAITDFKIGDRVFTHHHVACYSKDCHECSHGNETMCKKYYQ